MCNRKETNENIEKKEKCIRMSVNYVLIRKIKIRKPKIRRAKILKVQKFLPPSKQKFPNYSIKTIINLQHIEIKVTTRGDQFFHGVSTKDPHSAICST